MKSLSKLNAYIDGHLVGTLAMMSDGRVAFQYDKHWQKNGFMISPFDLPLTDEVFIPKNHDCQGLFGIFEDSLPDAWGTLLMNRKLGEMGIDPQKLNILDRLSLVGDTGEGDIEYRPAAEYHSTKLSDRSFDEIRAACDELLETGTTDQLDDLFQRGGSSGGARPKVYTNYQGNEWIVKFPLSTDPTDVGKQEYEYSLAAKDCGILMSDTHLFPSAKCAGYFGTRRFDRTQAGEKEHVATAKALMDLPFDMPSLDYSSLLQLTDILTNHNTKALRQMFLLACFNIFAHNQDDHSKNFSFIYDKNSDCWDLAPAYDLTYSTTAYNQHTTSANWNGNPSKDDLLTIAKPFNISKNKAEEMIEGVYQRTRKLLY